MAGCGPPTKEENSSVEPIPITTTDLWSAGVGGGYRPGSFDFITHHLSLGAELRFAVKAALIVRLRPPTGLDCGSGGRPALFKAAELADGLVMRTIRLVRIDESRPFLTASGEGQTAKQCEPMAHHLPPDHTQPRIDDDDGGVTAQFDIVTTFWSNMVSLRNLPLRQHWEMQDGTDQLVGVRMPTATAWMPCVVSWATVTAKVQRNTVRPCGKGKFPWLITVINSLRSGVFRPRSKCNSFRTHGLDVAEVDHEPCFSPHPI